MMALSFRMDGNLMKIVYKIFLFTISFFVLASVTVLGDSSYGRTSIAGTKEKLVNKKSIHQIYRLKLNVCDHFSKENQNVRDLHLYKEADGKEIAAVIKNKCEDKYFKYFDYNNLFDDESMPKGFLAISSKEYKDLYFKVFYKPDNKYYWLSRVDVKIETVEEWLKRINILPKVTVALHESPEGKKIIESLKVIDASEYSTYLDNDIEVLEVKHVNNWIWLKIKISFDEMGGTHELIGPPLEGWIMPFDKENGNPMYSCSQNVDS
jgi:hypothetical protein